MGAAMLLIGVDWSLALHAGKIAEDHALRGYDAVHLAHGTRLKRFSLLETYMTVGQPADRVDAAYEATLGGVGSL